MPALIATGRKATLDRQPSQPDMEHARCPGISLRYIVISKQSERAARAYQAAIGGVLGLRDEGEQRARDGVRAVQQAVLHATLLAKLHLAAQTVAHVHKARAARDVPPRPGRVQDACKAIRSKSKACEVQQCTPVTTAGEQRSPCRNGERHLVSQASIGSRCRQ